MERPSARDVLPSYSDQLRTDDAIALVLVEGDSDRVALETLAVRRGRDLAAAGVSIVALGGAQALGNALEAIRARERDVRLAGLCDAREAPGVQRALERAGLGSDLTRESMERLGFYVCDPDLEGELIRSLGAARVEAVLETNGNLTSFRTFQKQPQWQSRPTEAQLPPLLRKQRGQDQVRTPPRRGTRADEGPTPTRRCASARLRLSTPRGFDMTS